MNGLEAIFFYLFAFIAVAAAFMVISARNPVHSVLYLILTFFNAAALFLLTGAEFLAMILLVVYVGAVAVLFLFVVMMLDVDFAALRGAILPLRSLVRVGIKRASGLPGRAGQYGGGNRGVPQRLAAGRGICALWADLRRLCWGRTPAGR